MARDRKKGSRDRKIITDICYRFFRIGHLFPEKKIEDRLDLALFLTDTDVGLMLPEAWKSFNETTIDEKLKHVGVDLSVSSLFSFGSLLSDGINLFSFQQSFLRQPPVFIRIRPGYENTVIGRLRSEEITYSIVNDHCVSISPAVKLETYFSLNKEIVVQDASSQQVVPYMQGFFEKKDAINVWDCCAASGGKSIHLHDLFPQAKLTVTDIRKFVLHNLQVRFSEAGIKNYVSEVADLSKPHKSDEQYDLILADVPCSGSGTWTRTPERLTCFQQTELINFQRLQREIITNSVPNLKPGGYLLYSTCSAFRCENEEQVVWIENKFKIKSIQYQLIHGSDCGADTMFVALFHKNK